MYVTSRKYCMAKFDFMSRCGALFWWQSPRKDLPCHFQIIYTMLIDQNKQKQTPLHTNAYLLLTFFVVE